MALSEPSNNCHISVLELTDLFSAHGTVTSANVISDKFTGQSRRFGFVEMSLLEEAQAAIAPQTPRSWAGAR